MNHHLISLHTTKRVVILPFNKPQGSGEVWKSLCLSILVVNHLYTKFTTTTTTTTC